MEIFTHRRNLLEFENRNRVKIAKKSTFYEIPKWVNKLVENQQNALLPSYDTNMIQTKTQQQPPLSTNSISILRMITEISADYLLVIS